MIASLHRTLQIDTLFWRYHRSPGHHTAFAFLPIPSYPREQNVNDGSYHPPHCHRTVSLLKTALWFATEM